MLKYISNFINRTFKDDSVKFRPLFHSLLIYKGQIYITNTHYIIKFNTFINVFEFPCCQDEKLINNCDKLYCDTASQMLDNGTKAYTFTRQQFKDLLPKDKRIKYFKIDDMYLSLAYLKRFFNCNKTITFYHNVKQFYPVFFTGDKFNGVIMPLNIKAD